MHYPAFPLRISEGTRRQSAESALEIICKVARATGLGNAVLSALELYDGATPTPDTSPWLGKVRARLAELAPKQVLNNTDLFEKKEGRVWMQGEPLEAEWLLVVLAAGIEAGDLVVVGANNVRYDATDLRGFYQSIKAWDHVVRIARPSEVPVDRWRKLFRLVGAAEAKLANPNTFNDAIVDFQFRLQQHITRISQEMQDVTQVHPFEDPASREALKTSTEFLGVVRERLGSLTDYNTRAKMQNLIMPDADIEQLGKRFKELGRVSDLLRFLNSHRRELQALERYRDILPTSLAPSFHEKLSALGSKLRDGYADPSAFADGPGRAALEQSLEAAVKEAISTYQRLHKLYSLDSEADKRKKRLLEGTELRRLNRLVMITAINKAPLEAVREALGRLPVYRSSSREDLLNSATSLCPHTKWDPRSLPENPLPALDVLAHCESEISRLHQAWIDQLLGELEDPAIKSALEALKSEERAPIDAFLTSRELPEKIEDSFISAVNTALGGLRRRIVASQKLAKAVLGGSAPLKVSEVKDRFNRWLQD